jgi:putative DNA primase/helicase
MSSYGRGPCADMAEGFTRPPTISGEQRFKNYFAARGITPEQANRAGMTYLSSAKIAHPKHRDRPAIGIAYSNPDGSPLTYDDGGVMRDFSRVRYLDPAPMGRDGKPMRYRQPPNSPVPVYLAQGIEGLTWLDVFNDPDADIVFTEGEPKGLAGSIHGFNVIALGGVDSFRGKDGRLLPELQRIVWKGRNVYIVYDSDAATNPNVLRARSRLAAELVRLEAVVRCVDLPAAPDGGKLGLDDFIVSYGADALERLLEQTAPLDPGKGSIREGTDIEIADAVLIDLEIKHFSEIIYCDGQFHAYVETHWTPLADEQVRNAVYGYDALRFKPGGGGVIKLSKGRTDSILSVMRDRAVRQDFFADAPAGINCGSGFIVLDDAGEPTLEPHDREHRQRHCLPGAWTPGASWQSAPLLNRYLNGSFRDDPDAAGKIGLVSEMCGVAAMGAGTALKSPRAIVLHGMSADNGKSELLEMMRGLLPPDAVCSVPPSKLGDQAMLIEVRGKRLNVCAELGTTNAIASDIFKSVVTGDQISARALYKAAEFFKPSALHVCATNALPPFAGGFDKGVQRRLLVLTFNRSIPKDEQVAGIGGRIAAEEADQLLAFAVDGMRRVAKAGRFSEPASSAAALREWVFNADPVLAWYATRAEYNSGGRVLTKHAYADFVDFAAAEGYRAERLPAVNVFVSRLLAQDGRLSRHKNDSERSIVGLALRPLGVR